MMDHMTVLTWERWKRVAEAHMRGDGYEGDYAEAAKYIAQRQKEATEMLEWIFGCEDMEDLDATLREDLAFCERAMAYYADKGA